MNESIICIPSQNKSGAGGGKLNSTGKEPPASCQIHLQPVNWTIARRIRLFEEEEAELQPRWWWHIKAVWRVKGVHIGMGVDHEFAMNFELHIFIHGLNIILINICRSRSTKPTHRIDRLPNTRWQLSVAAVGKSYWRIRNDELVTFGWVDVLHWKILRQNIQVLWRTTKSFGKGGGPHTELFLPQIPGDGSSPLMFKESGWQLAR